MILVLDLVVFLTHSTLQEFITGLLAVVSTPWGHLIYAFYAIEYSPNFPTLGDIAISLTFDGFMPLPFFPSSAIPLFSSLFLITSTFTQ